jgi:hypothetical protein
MRFLLKINAFSNGCNASPKSKTRIYDQVFRSADKEIQNHYDNTVAVGLEPGAPDGNYLRAR